MADAPHGYAREKGSHRAPHQILVVGLIVVGIFGSRGEQRADHAADRDAAANNFRIIGQVELFDDGAGNCLGFDDFDFAGDLGCFDDDRSGRGILRSDAALLGVDHQTDGRGKGRCCVEYVEGAKRQPDHTADPDAYEVSPQKVGNIAEGYTLLASRTLGLEVLIQHDF